MLVKLHVQITSDLIMLSDMKMAHCMECVDMYSELTPVSDSPN
jgi:hypothetical protein